ncbi:MAG: hypothetical protein CMA81_03475 [Euryarchaeota archaeon]|nr:hypothetical protein [Euryarchaeota archaeon]
MRLSEVDVLLQPLGETPGVLEPPIASYKPQIIVLIAGKQEDIKLAKDHLEEWGHVRNPKIIEKIVEEPWTESTLVRYMKAFDEAVNEVENIAKDAKINWHVGVTGGTNFMAIASAFSAFTHRFPVYGSDDPKHTPKKTVQERLIEMELFMNLGPAFKELSKKPRSLEILQIIANNSIPSQAEILEHYSRGTPQNISAAVIRLRELSLIVHTDTGIEVTELAKLLLERLANN